MTDELKAAREEFQKSAQRIAELDEALYAMERRAESDEKARDLADEFERSARTLSHGAGMEELKRHMYLSYLAALRSVDQETARKDAEIVAIVHGCGVAYHRILRAHGLKEGE